MRKLGATVLAVPVLAAIYLASIRSHGGVHRISAGLGAAAIIALVAMASLPPAPSAAVPASAPQPVAAQVLDSVRTGHAVNKPIEITFDAPMDAASVAGAFRISPDSAVSLSWDRAGQALKIAPTSRWRPDTLYTVTIDGTARSEAGGRLASAVHALVLTEAAGRGSIAATRQIGGRVRADTSFTIKLDRPVGLAALRAALRSEPSLKGDLQPGATSGEFTFKPWSKLAAASTYRVWLEGLEDADGVPFAATSPVEVSTAKAPSVVRFRPFDGSSRIERGAILSVRFTRPMNRAATGAAFKVTAGGDAVAGKISWAEAGTVLVFQPSKPLAYGATVVMSVDGAARSKAGNSVGTSTATFKVAPKPKAAPQTAAHKSSGSNRAIHHSGGSGAAGGSWHAVEVYYLRLMNCTRQGGWVKGGGSCASPGGRHVSALWISSSISDRVSRPYARLLATRNQCDHFIGGTPGDRLRRAGFGSYRWAENLGCRSGNPYSAVLGSHLYFQSEKSYRGGHYVNLMNGAYDRVGLGVWVASGRVRLVVDFYHP